MPGIGGDARTREAEMRRISRALRTLSSCNQALIHSANEVELLTEVCRAIVEDGGGRLGSAGYAENGVRRTARPVARARQRQL